MKTPNTTKNPSLPSHLCLKAICGHVCGNSVCKQQGCSPPNPTAAHSSPITLLQAAETHGGSPQMATGVHQGLPGRMPHEPKQDRQMPSDVLKSK